MIDQWLLNGWNDWLDWLGEIQPPPLRENPFHTIGLFGRKMKKWKETFFEPLFYCYRYYYLDKLIINFLKMNIYINCVCIRGRERLMENILLLLIWMVFINIASGPYDSII